MKRIVQWQQSKSILLSTHNRSLFSSNQNYMQIRISNVNNEDIALFQYAGVDIDHANYEIGSYIEFAISDYDIDKIIEKETSIYI